MARLAESRAARIALAIFGFVTIAASWLTLFEFGITENVLFAMAITALLSFFAILVHELGHAVAALRYRQPIHAFAVLPFELRFRPLRLSMAGQGVDRDLGGYVVYGDGDPSRRTVGRIAAAGPLASFLLAIAAASAGMLFPLLAPDLGEPLTLASGPTPTPSRQIHLPSEAEVAAFHAAYSARAAATIWSGLSYALAILSAGMGVANLVPRRGSDGEIILRCLLRPWTDGARQR